MAKPNTYDSFRAASTKKTGDEAWAYAYQETTTKEQKLYFQKPTLGIFAHSQYADKHEEDMKNRDSKFVDTIPRYFVPYGKNGKPAFSKAVHIWARSYADTEAEAQIGYDCAVMRTAMFHLESAKEVLSHILDPSSQAYHTIASWSTASGVPLPSVKESPDDPPFVEGADIPYTGDDN